MLPRHDRKSRKYALLMIEKLRLTGTSFRSFPHPLFLEPLQTRLVGGSGSHEGRVEVLYDGAWGTVCDDGWDSVDADVVCRSLGFARASTYNHRAAFGQGPGSIVLSQSPLQQCGYQPSLLLAQWLPDAHLYAPWRCRGCLRRSGYVIFDVFPRWKDTYICLIFSGNRGLKHIKPHLLNTSLNFPLQHKYLQENISPYFRYWYSIQFKWTFIFFTNNTIYK